MRRSSWLVVIALGVATLACGRDKAAPPPPPPDKPAAPAGVALFVNDQPAGTVTAAQLAGWPRLDALVPPEARRLGTWESVTLVGDQAKPSELGHPSTSYPEMVPAVFPGDGGPAFGMFDPLELARKGKAALREDHVREIRIKLATGGGRGQNDDGGGAATDPTKLVLTVKSPAGTTTLSGDKLLGIPREPQPGNPDQKGWRIATLLAAAGVTARPTRMVLTDAAGTNLTLEQADLTDATVPFVKLNKQGALRLRVMKKVGDGWNPSGDLRALASIEVK